MHDGTATQPQSTVSSRLDRRVIYLLIALALAIPLTLGVTRRPAPQETADAFFSAIDKLKEGDFVLIAADWGPSTKAENKPQTEVAIEHLMRRRVRFGLISIIPYAVPFLRSMPEEIARRLEAEMPDQRWSYGKDWVNFGFQPGASIMVQGLAKASNIQEFLKSDERGTPLADLTALSGIKTLRDVDALIEITGSVGAFNMWLQFFQAGGYQPPYLHACTSVTIPEAYNYFVSKQIVGLHEGIAGAAWYEELLSQHYPAREKGSALRIMTGISAAHLLIIVFIILGNLAELSRSFGRSDR